jgi:ABC-type branched-subunit amino acid transport system ATPase component
MAGILRLPSFFKGEEEMAQKALEFLKIFGLHDKANELAKNLLMDSKDAWRLPEPWQLNRLFSYWMNLLPV